MHDEIRQLIESEWETQLGLSTSDLRGSGVQVVVADVGANAAMSFLFDTKCIVAVPAEGFDAALRSAGGLDASDAFTSRFLRSLLHEDGVVVAGGLMSEWRGYYADVGVLTHPEHREQGLAKRVVATMTAATLPTAGVVRYRALTTNLPSLAVARSLGFEEFGQNYRARFG